MKRLILSILFLLLSTAALNAQTIYEQPATVLGHGLIRELVWSPDGELLIINTTTGIYLQNPDDLSQAPRKLQDHAEIVWAVAFSPDGQTMATGAGDRTVTLWDIDGTTLTEHTTIPVDLPLETAPEGVTRLRFTQDNTLLIGDTGIQGPGLSVVVDVANETLHELPAMRLTNIATEVDEGAVFIGESNAEILRVISTANGIEFEVENSVVEGWQLSRDGRFAASGISVEEGTQIVEVSSGDRIANVSPVTRGYFSNKSGYFISSNDADGEPVLANLITGKGFSLTNDRYQISPQETYLAYFEYDDKLMLMSSQDGALRELASGISYSVQMTFSPNDVFLLTREPYEENSKSLLKLWNTDTGEVLHEFEYAQVQPSTYFSDDSRYLVISTNPMAESLTFFNQHSFIIIDTQTGKEVTQFVGRSHFGFRPNDADEFYYINMGALVRLNVTTGETETVKLPGHTGEVLDLAYSPDGTLLASTGTDGTLRVWDVAAGTEQVLMRNAAPQFVFFNADGTQILTNFSEDEVVLFDARSGELLVRLVFANSIFTVSADAEKIAVFNNGTVTITDFEAFRFRGSYGVPIRTVYAMEFNGNELLMAGLDWDRNPVMITLDTRNGDFVERVNNSPVAFPPDLAFNPVGDRVAVAGDVRVWETRRGIVEGTLFAAPQPRQGGVAFSPDGRYLLTAKDDLIRPVTMLDAETGDLVATFERDMRSLGGVGIGGYIRYQPIVFRPDGEQFAMTERGGAIVLWDMPDIQPETEEAVNILAYCARIDNRPQTISADQNINLEWSWFATEIPLIYDHMENVRYKLTLNGSELPHTSAQKSAIRRDRINDNHWTLYYSLPLGQLQPGEYTVTYEASWVQAISDGIEAFGPGTPIERETGTCTFRVTD